MPNYEQSGQERALRDEEDQYSSDGAKRGAIYTKIESLKEHLEVTKGQVRILAGKLHKILSSGPLLTAAEKCAGRPNFAIPMVNDLEKVLEVAQEIRNQIASLNDRISI